MPSKGRRNKRNISCFGKFACSRALPGSFERLRFLEELVEEFKSTDNTDHKEQIVANLANFAYDPRNCSHLRQLEILDLFFNCLDAVAPSWSESALGINQNPVAAESAVRLAELSLGGIANLAALSPIYRSLIVEHPKLIFVVAGLAASQPLVVIHCFTILIHLFTKSASADLTDPSPSLPDRFPAAVRAAQTYQQAVTGSAVNASTPLDPRIGILSRLLLEDCC